MRSAVQNAAIKSSTRIEVKASSRRCRHGFAVAWGGGGFCPRRLHPPAVRASDPGELACIEQALRSHQGNVAGTARALGLHRTQLRRLIERHGRSAALCSRRDGAQAGSRQVAVRRNHHFELRLGHRVRKRRQSVGKRVAAEIIGSTMIRFCASSRKAAANGPQREPTTDISSMTIWVSAAANCAAPSCPFALSLTTDGGA